MRSHVNIRHIFVVDCAAILGRLWTDQLVCAIISCPKTHKETKRKNVGRHAVKYGPAGRHNTPLVDWKNGGFQLDCRFILTWHAAGRVGGCDDWRKEEKENKRRKHLETSGVQKGDFVKLTFISPFNVSPLAFGYWFLWLRFVDEVVDKTRLKQINTSLKMLSTSTTS